MRLSRWSGATEIQNNSSLLVIKRTSRVFLDFGLETQGFERVWVQIGRCEVCEHHRQLQSSKWEEKSIICARNAIFWHAAPTGKLCTAGVGMQEGEKSANDDKSLQGGQGPNLVGLDAPSDSSNRRKAVKDRISTIEGNVTTLDAKLDLILGKFKSTHVKDVDSDEDVVEGWAKDIEEAWTWSSRGVGP